MKHKNLNKHRYLTDEQIAEARRLREQGYTKRTLSIKYEVGSTTIWENVYCENFQRPKKTKIYEKKKQLQKCPSCEKFMTREVEDIAIPLNFQVLDRCISCYLRSIGLSYMDVL